MIDLIRSLARIENPKFGASVKSFEPEVLASPHCPTQGPTSADSSVGSRPARSYSDGRACVPRSFPFDVESARSNSF
ncbi:unnamed protein product, partial [Nesidiocoris tenuis]